MTEPTYRIETKFEGLLSKTIPWSARIVRLTDGDLVGRGDGATEEAAVHQARQFIKQHLQRDLQGQTLYATEDGQLVGDDGQPEGNYDDGECPDCGYSGHGHRITCPRAARPA